MIGFICNGAAGGARDEVLDEIRRRLAGCFEIHEVAVCDGKDPAACAREALAAGPELVLAAGGDGTVSGVAGVLAGTGVPLGVIPLGTSNSFATALGIAGIEDTIAAVQAGHRRLIDTARCTTSEGPRSMILHGSIGFHTEAELATPEAAKHRWGQLAYIASALRQLGELPEFEVELTCAGQVMGCHASAVAVANVVPRKTVLAHGPAEIDPEDGLLDVTIVAMRSVREALATGLHLLRQAALGEAAHRDNVAYFACRRVRIATTPAMSVLIDGEAAGMTALSVESVPASLTVVAPPDPEPL